MLHCYAEFCWIQCVKALHNAKMFHTSYLFSAYNVKDSIMSVPVYHQCNINYTVKMACTSV